MATSDLIQNVLTTPGFAERLRQVTVESVSRQFPTLQELAPLFSGRHDWSYLLMCATLLAQSDKGEAQDAALRIAHHSLSSRVQDDRIKAAAYVTLDMLTNRPAMKLAEDRGLITTNYFKSIPLPLRMDWVQRAVKYSIVLGNNTIVHTNRFQRMLWDDVETCDWLSVSAPTSAGKSFLLINWLAEYLRNRDKLLLVVYVVPTRALIQQVQLDIEAHFMKHGFHNIEVSCLPLTAQMNRDGHTVFVLTQERLHILLNNLRSEQRIDLLVVDEAQKVGDGARGVLLQIVVEAVASHSPDAKFVFASPATDNPETLLDDAPDNTRKKGFRSEQVTVNQNLLWVSSVPQRPKTWKVELCLKDAKVELGTIELGSRPTSPAKRLAFVAYEMGRVAERDAGGNLIYVNGPADAEKIAQLLYGLIGQAGEISGLKPISDLSELIRRVIHPRYSLATVINRGVAFHYGNMPLLIRNEIERLFKENVIRFLVCTSTLVEGVNLPATSIFVRGPEKGQNTPMGEADFWNLAGRAGRMGKEFQGNVVCIDPYDRLVWPDAPPTERRRQQIERATDTVLSDGETFLKYVKGDTAAVEKKLLPKYEHVLGYLFGHVFRHGSLRNSRLAARFPDHLVSKLDEVLITAKDTLRIPKRIVERNPGVSPLYMDSLLKYFETYDKQVEELFPKYPEETDASVSLVRVFMRINKYLAPTITPFGGSRKRVFALSILVVNWMRGHPLARLISKREELHPNEPLPKIIRESMDDVERVARFLAPKYVSCYTDILRYYLITSGRTELIDRLPDLTLYLEFGASQQTQLSLMSLGLSRTSAILMSDFIPRDDLDQEACLEWIQETDLGALELPSLVVQEAERLKTFAN